jgi:outer membrane murein-binding lipoprotein Lpp
MERKQDQTGKRQELGTTARRWIIAGLVVLLLSGCSASNESKQASTASSEAPMADMMQMQNTTADTAAAVPSGNSNSAAPAQQEASNQAKEQSNVAKPADSFNAIAPGGAAAVDRKIIYKANLTMQVDNYPEAQAKIESAVSLAGGYILQFNESETTYEKSGSFVVKVPANGFQSLLKQLETIHPSVKKNMQGQDVSEEFVDLSSRLKAKQLVESRLIGFMEKAAKTDELLAFSNELGKVQEEIERIKGRMRYLEQNVSYSTIEIRLSQKLGSAAVIQANDRGPLFQRAAAALNESAIVLILVFQWIIVAAAAILPVALVLALLGFPIYWVRRSRRKKRVEIRNKLLGENSETKINASPEIDAEEKE